MGLQAMSVNQKVVLFVVLSAAWVSGLWYWLERRPEEERSVVARLLNAKTLSLEAKMPRRSSGLEALTGDNQTLARTFRVLERNAATPAGAQVSLPLYDLDATDQIILWMFPPDIANLGGTFFRVDEAFWHALLDRAPKTREWLEKNPPKKGPSNVPKPAAKAQPVA